MNNAKKIKYLAIAGLWVLVSCIPAYALDPHQPVSSYLRTHFTSTEGLPGSVVGQMGQTKDGFLWMVLESNILTRFDGKNFYLFPTPRAITLAVAPDGDLWVGTSDGLIRIPSSSLNQFQLTGLKSYQPGPGKARQINCLRFGKSGTLYVGTNDGLFRFDKDQFVAVGPRVTTRQIEEAPDGHLLLVTEEEFIEFAGSEIVPHPKLADRLGVNDSEILHVLKDGNGNTWYCTAKGIARETNGRIEKLGTYAKISRATIVVYRDEQGTVWFGNDEGLFRATSAGLELMIAGIQARNIYSDPSGNLWVGTNGDGLYVFKDRAIRMYTTADGLPNNLLMTVIATRDGAVWTGANCGGISRFDGTHFQTYNEKNGLLNSCVFALAEGLNGDLWIGTWGGGAFNFHDGRFTQYSKNSGLGDDVVLSIVAARDGAIWFGTREGLTRLKNGEFRNYSQADGLSGNKVQRVFEDSAGVIWVGSRNGLDRMAGDRFEHFASLPKTLIIPFGQDREGGFFVNVDVDAHGVTRRIDKDRIDTINDLAAVDLVQTKDGELWFCGGPLVRMQPSSLKKTRPRDEPLDYETFSISDGLATTDAPSLARCLALTPDDKLWAATPKGLAMLDLRRLQVTTEKPSIYLTDVIIGRNSQRADREVELPPGTNHAEIHFAAIDVSAPEKIRLQYRLDGVDSEWLDAPANSNAIYSRIPVGSHALHIRACNRFGIWDRQGVVFMVTQRPYFYQTRWFVAAMFALGALLIFVIYRLRVAQISRMLSARFDERLAERTRVARELHDTFLQTVQGSKMVADHALKNSADHARMVRAMEQVSTWLGQANKEGRAALQSLRGSTTEKNDLAEAFSRAIDECRMRDCAEISFSVIGNSKEMHPVVRDEIFRIGYEAIRNACAHSGSDRLDVTIKYASDFMLAVSDYGIGIESEVLENGKDGHFGLRGMRERAERIGSKFTLSTAADSGTAITLVVPGRIAFRPS